MKIHGLHHITMITGDGQRNVAFYAGVLGLRLVKQTLRPAGGLPPVSGDWLTGLDPRVV